MAEKETIFEEIRQVWQEMYVIGSKIVDVTRVGEKKNVYVAADSPETKVSLTEDQEMAIISEYVRLRTMLINKANMLPLKMEKSVSVVK